MSNHIAIFDIGKTNKKLLVFDEDYQVVYEYAEELPQTKDEDGDECEDIALLSQWCLDQWHQLKNNTQYSIQAINFSGYGASFVLVHDHTKKWTGPLYNYLKPYPASIQSEFFNHYGPEKKISLETSSPSMGSLNSGLQLYRLIKIESEPFKACDYALHLPQYLSYLFSKTAVTEITSIGCHTMLWDYNQRSYHHWVLEENVVNKLAPIKKATDILATDIDHQHMAIGTGMHDSSAAMVPYLKSSSEPFILLSTGTWCIALNPFNHAPLTDYELKNDCLAYLSYTGDPIKASRLFLGFEHDEQVKQIASHFGTTVDFYKKVSFDPSALNYTMIDSDVSFIGSKGLYKSGFEKRRLFDFTSAQQAYHVLISDMVRLQKRAIQFVMSPDIQKIYIDGGFAKNKIFNQLLSSAFPKLEIIPADLPQASAVGAAMVIHEHWNPKPLSLKIKA